MKYLLDTNIFLEILLKQVNSENCKKFISANSNEICISDFALHSIGVILFRNEQYEVFNLFLKNFISGIYVLTLDKDNYSNISKLSNKYGMDFDDCYQLTVASEFKLTLITLDSDSNKLKKEYKILNIF
jgi:predicted nucleic acid-binding protein